MRIMFIFLLFISTVISAVPVSIVSDGSWKSFDSEQTGWNTVGFDDSSWRNAFENYATTGEPFPGAKVIWDFAGTNPSGTDGPITAYFRKTVNLGSTVNSATLDFQVDDEVDVFVNGVLAFRDRSNGATTQTGVTIDASLFNSGDNLIAIFAFDGGITPFPRGGENLAFSLNLDLAPVPEPSNVVLLVLGIVGVSRLRRYC